jgi:hypothetical protein
MRQSATFCDICPDAGDRGGNIFVFGIKLAHFGSPPEASAHGTDSGYGQRTPAASTERAVVEGRRTRYLLLLYNCASSKHGRPAAYLTSAVTAMTNGAATVSSFRPVTSMVAIFLSGFGFSQVIR